MNRWRKFLKLRKQNDSVKVLLIFGFIGIISLIRFFSGAFNLYRNIHQPEEYVLTAGGLRPLTGYVDEIRKIDDIKCVCLQKEASVTLNINNRELSFSCLILSPEYMEKVYAVDEKGQMPVFYMNASAAELMKNDGQLSEKDIEEIDGWRVDYVLASDGLSEKSTAKLAFLESRVAEENPLIYCSKEEGDLPEGTDNLRVCLSKGDLDGTRVNQFTRMGLDVVNKEEIRIKSANRDGQLLQIKYDGLIAALCILFIVGLIKYGKEPVLKD
nr:hypothetical protein [Frisingicoccus sp.]